jgi:hypothetical protein
MSRRVTMDPFKEFEPLMKQIQRVLKSLEGKDLPFEAKKHVAGLDKKFKEYESCCCFRAKVIPYKPYKLLKK